MKTDEVVAMWSTGRKLPRGDLQKRPQNGTGEAPVGVLCANWDAEAVAVASRRTWSATLRGAVFKAQPALVVYLTCEVGEIAFVLDAVDPMTNEFAEGCWTSGRLLADLQCLDGTASIEATVERETLAVEPRALVTENSRTQFLFMALMFMDAYEDLEGMLAAGRRAARKHFQWCLVATPSVLRYVDVTVAADDSEFGTPDKRGVRLRYKEADE